MVATGSTSRAERVPRRRRRRAHRLQHSPVHQRCPVDLSLTTMLFTREGKDPPGSHRAGHLPGRPGTAELAPAGHLRLADALGRQAALLMTADSNEKIRTLLETRTRAFDRRDCAAAPPLPATRNQLQCSCTDGCPDGEASTDRSGGIDLYCIGIGHEIGVIGDHRRRCRFLPLPGSDQRHHAGRNRGRHVGAGDGPPPAVGEWTIVPSTRRCPSTPTPARPSCRRSSMALQHRVQGVLKSWLPGSDRPAGCRSSSGVSASSTPSPASLMP